MESALSVADEAITECKTKDWHSLRVEPLFVFLKEEDEKEALPESRQTFEVAAVRILDLSFMFKPLNLSVTYKAVIMCNNT